MSEKAIVELPDGTVRESQKIRCYSWVITSARRIAATKSHREWLLSQCLSPPDAPFVICISDSGQKHLLYRAVVCHSRDVVTVTLESERVTFKSEELFQRLSLCKMITAVLGKPALAESLSIRQRMSVVEYHGNDLLLNAWLLVREQSLTRLAIWFCPPKKECENEYPAAQRT
jgi:CRISPR type IV-associated protein Csf1